MDDLLEAAEQEKVQSPVKKSAHASAENLTTPKAKAPPPAPLKRPPKTAPKGTAKSSPKGSPKTPRKKGGCMCDVEHITFPPPTHTHCRSSCPNMRCVYPKFLYTLLHFPLHYGEVGGGGRGNKGKGRREGGEGL